MKFIKRIKQVLIITLIAFTLAGAALVYITIRYQEQIVQLFIEEANKRINTPVEVEKVHFSILRNFPLITVSLDSVRISESYEKSEKLLAKAGALRFSFNLFKALKQNISVEGIQLSEADVLVRLNKDGVPNYRILSEGNGSKTPFFDLRNIRLTNVNFKYLQESNGTTVELYTPDAQATLSGNKHDIQIRASGTWIFKGVTTSGKTWFEQKTVKASALANYNSEEKKVVIADSQIDIGGGKFGCTGFVDTDDKELKLDLEGKNTNINTLLSLLPYQTSKQYRSYRSKGDVYFKSAIGGNYSLSRGIDIKADFGASNAYFYHPKYKKGIENVHFKGTFNNGALNTPSTYQLKINDFSCVLDDQHIVGGIEYENFDDPRILCEMKGEININSLLDIFPNQLIRSAYGKIEADINCAGKLSDLKSRYTRDKFKAQGEIILKNVSFILHGERLPFNSFNGSFIFNKSDLAISEFTGNIGNSDFRLSGFFKSILSYVFSKKQELNMVADLQSDHVDFDELLRSNFASRDTTDASGGTYNFAIASNVNIDFNCDIRHLNFKRFHGRNMKGQLNINNRIAMFDNVSVNAMGGRILMEGSVGNRNARLVEVLTEAQLQGLNIDSIFYVFKNFNQNWLVDKNLKGRIHANVNTYMSFDDHLKLNKSSLIADISTRIDNGELINFEPMLKLSKYVEEKSLAHLRFSELRNEIHISGQKIQLPEMTIRSNVTSLDVSGTHTFDQEIDYHISVPLVSVFNVRKRKDFEENAVDGGNLLLKITGTTRDYKVSFDGSALGREITKDFKDEKSEWKEMKENKGRTRESTIKLEENEYFEFDDKEEDQQ